MKLEDYSLRLDQLLSEINDFISDGCCIRDNHFLPWVDRYNNLISVFNSEFNRQVPMHGISDTTHSKSGKTITPAAVNSLKHDIANLKESIDKTIEDSHRFHCFKIGHKCPHEIKQDHYLFFVGMPFDNIHKDSYEYGIKMMLETHGIDIATKVFKADEKFSNTDLMCKICKAIQESKYIIINISGQNPNVMFELGLAYGLNKQVFLLKDENSTEVSDLKGLEYIEYAHAGDLSNKLLKRFTEMGII